MRYSALFAALLLGACTAADRTIGESSPSADVWMFGEHVEDLRAQSCPQGTTFQRASDLPISVIDTERGTNSALKMNLTGLTLAGAWQLEAENDEFGGLSGMDVLRSGSLLTVSDDGKFVWIGVDPVTGAPDGIGSIAYMRNTEGKIFPTKRAADAEDLAFRDGLAFVSFEQTHRIEAYDLETCGTAAHAARVVTLDKVVAGDVLRNNRGPEGLALVGETLEVGFEANASGGSPYGTARIDGTLENLQRTRQPLLYMLTGLDHEDGLSTKVFRAYDPARGARAILQVYANGEQIAEARLKPPLPVDNFEAVALGTAPDGARRIWLLSDDNFSSDQRTLLLALDLDVAL
ncbi:MAG: esterase-like activity of phytase family protein [Pseudomonadota bacterium]